ncbi:MAG: mechanosensitive ion channel family protein [Bacteroidota bacterium]
MKLLRHCLLPGMFLILFLALNIYLKSTDAIGVKLREAGIAVSFMLIVTFVTWFVIKVIRFFKNRFLRHYDVTREDNLKSRKVHTQINILERVLIILVIILSLSIILLSFDELKKYGVSLFASAGVAGLIIGLAAQKMIGSVLAGLQIAITQPVRIDDAVIVEGEWGRIEEITLTYVVVRIWDKRRLVVPSTYFIEKPFQNWTRSSAEIIGTVYLYTDYTVSVDALREELTRLLENSRLWDKQVNVLQVVNASEKAMELRALVSARNSPTAWDLQVYIREKLIEFLQKNFPDSLPRSRVLLEQPGQAKQDAQEPE